MTIKQIKVGYDNFSYVIFDPENTKAAVVDPSYDISKTNEFIQSNNLNLEYIICTHYHSDHTSQTKNLQKLHPGSQIVASEIDGSYLDVDVDVVVSDNDKLSLGDITLEFLLTPGHTPDGICIIVDNEAILTGDTLFIDDCGRADLPGGYIKDLFESLQHIKKLSDKIVIYPGHNYGSKSFDTLGNQKKTNKTLLARNMDEFSKIP